MTLAIFKAALVSLVLVLVGVDAAGPVTLYRAGIGGFDPSQGVETIVALTAVGVGANGGTTYAEVDVNLGVIVLSLKTGTPVSTTFTAVETGTVQFVEHASWVFRGYAIGSQKFNGFEQNCTLNDASKNTTQCVEVVRDVVGGTTQTTTQTITEPLRLWFTYTGPQPTSTSSAPAPYSYSKWLSAFGIALASVEYYW